MNKTLISAAVSSVLSFSAGLAMADGSGHGGDNDNNPAITAVIEGRYAAYDHGFELPGFQLGDEAGVYEKGFSTGHNELNVTSQISEDIFGALSLSLASGHDGGSVNVEEAYFESSALGSRVNVKVGQFFSHIGHLNVKHEHRQDFADVPLVYMGMFNNHLVDTGVQVSWQQDMGVNLQLGVEATRGTGFPGGENDSHTEGLALFAKIGGKVSKGTWSAGISSYSSEFTQRESGGHHGGAETLRIGDGSTDVTGLDLAYTMSPNGIGKDGEMSMQAEYFARDEHGRLDYSDGAGETFVSDYDGDQTGYYMQIVYSFLPSWRVGLRYDNVKADNLFPNPDGANTLTDEDTGMHADEASTRITLMLDVQSSAKSLVRLQYTEDESGHVPVERIYMQYLATLGGE